MVVKVPQRTKKGKGVITTPVNDDDSDGDGKNSNSTPASPDGGVILQEFTPTPKTDSNERPVKRTHENGDEASPAKKVHTADGISIRFPRVTKVRKDRSWKEATDLPRLKKLFEKSKDTSDIVITRTKKGKGAVKTPVKKQKSSNDDDSDGDGSGGVILQELTPRQTSSERPLKRKHGDEASPAKKILPNVFTGTKVCLSEHRKKNRKYRKMERKIRAYDGEIVPVSSQSTATHVVVADDYDGPAIKCMGVCVTESWLWKCIKKKIIQPTKDFLMNS